MTPEVLNKDGLVAASPDTIFTFGGGTIRPLDPSVEDIDIVSIAHSLSQQCRWTGHSSQFYSVAEHSILVSMMVPGEYKLEALLHDASEAYLSDLARPVKKAPGLGEVYLQAELALESAIAEKFQLSPPPMSAEVKYADEQMLRREAHQLIPHLGVLMPLPDWMTPWVWCWSPQMAEMKYLELFLKYGGVE